MAKNELKGTIQIVNQPQTVGEKNTKKQTFVLKIPAYRDEWGEVKGKDEEWEIAIMGDSVEKFGLTRDHQGKRAKCSVYLNSNSYTKAADNTTGYIINATLAAIEYPAERTASNPPAGNTTNNSDSTNGNW